MLVIIQARTQSKRLKGKVLKVILGKPVIQHLIDNLKKSKLISNIVVATSKNKSDQRLAKLLKKIKINIYRGSHLNVADRLLKAAKKFNKDNYFIRVSADSPFLDFRIVNRVIKKLHKTKIKNPDIVTNVYPRSFPSGQSVEIINQLTLTNYIKQFNKDDIEHVTKYFYRYSSNFLIINVLNKSKKNKIKMSIDTIEDFNLLKKYKLKR